MGRVSLHDFNNGRGLKDTQADRLGIRLADPKIPGDVWVYGQFYQTTRFRPGLVVRHAGATNIADGTATAAAAIGSNILEDTGEFANDDFRGALGYIDSGDGSGQSFYVVDVLNDDTIEIAILSGVDSYPSLPGDTGWRTALTTSSTYVLTLPGRFYVAGSGAEERIAGVCKVDVTPTADYKPYGVVKQKGSIMGRWDQSNSTVPTLNGYVRHLANGLIAGVATLGRTAIGLADAVPAGTADELIPITLTSIFDTPPSYRFAPDTEVVLNRYTIK